MVRLGVSMRKMKDCGIDWIGQIPSDWNVKKCKYVTEFINGFPFESEALKDEYLYPVVRISDIKDGAVSFDSCLGVDNNSGLSSFLVKRNDILLAMSGATVGKVGIVRNDCAPAYINQRVGIIRTKCPNFLFYCLSTNNFIEYVILISAGTAQPNVSTKGFGEFPVPFPPLDEQKKIADFLDEKCGEIDSIRSDIQKQIDILNDYKKSVITEAVTKGLDPKVKLKDSGIKWIGKIPEHWDVHPLYYYFGERKHKNVLGEEKNLLSISYGKIIRKNIDSKEGLLPENFNGYNIIEKDDIVMRLTDLQNDKRSLRTGLVKEHGIITSAYVTLKAKRDLNAVYFHYLLHCYDLLKVLYNMGNGVRQGLNFSELSRMMLIEPPIVEQKAIADYLDEKCSEIDATIADKQKQLETLDEYKKSLIFEYVTGKKEVLA